MNTIAAIFLFAALFAAFGFVKHRPDCGSNCGGCSIPCELREKKS